MTLPDTCRGLWLRQNLSPCGSVLSSSSRSSQRASRTPGDAGRFSWRRMSSRRIFRLVAVLRRTTSSDGAFASVRRGRPRRVLLLLAPRLSSASASASSSGSSSASDAVDDAFLSRFKNHERTGVPAGAGVEGGGSAAFDLSRISPPRRPRRPPPLRLRGDPRRHQEKAPPSVSSPPFSAPPVSTWARTSHPTCTPSASVRAARATRLSGRRRHPPKTPRRVVADAEGVESPISRRSPRCVRATLRSRRDARRGGGWRRGVGYQRLPRSGSRRRCSPPSVEIIGTRWEGASAPSFGEMRHRASAQTRVFRRTTESGRGVFGVERTVRRGARPPGPPRVDVRAIFRARRRAPTGRFDRRWISRRHGRKRRRMGGDGGGSRTCYIRRAHVPVGAAPTRERAPALVVVALFTRGGGRRRIETEERGGPPTTNTCDADSNAPNPGVLRGDRVRERSGWWLWRTARTRPVGGGGDGDDARGFSARDENRGGGGDGG